MTDNAIKTAIDALERAQKVVEHKASTTDEWMHSFCPACDIDRALSTLRALPSPAPVSDGVREAAQALTNYLDPVIKRLTDDNILPLTTSDLRMFADALETALANEREQAVFVIKSTNVRDGLCGYFAEANAGLVDTLSKARRFTLQDAIQLRDMDGGKEHQEIVYAPKPPAPELSLEEAARDAARQIMTLLGYAQEPSMEPGADALRDKVEALIARAQKGA